MENRFNQAAYAGLIVGAVKGIIYLLQIFFPQSGLISTLTFLARIGVLVLVYYLAKSFRDKYLGGYCSYGRAYSQCLWIYLFASVITTLFQFVHMQFLQPDYLTEVFNEMMLAFEQAGLTSAEIETFSDFGVPTAAQTSIACLFGNMLLGAFVSLIIAAFVRKEDYLANNQ